MRIGFDNEKYLALQAEHIRERIARSSAASCIWSSAASCSTTTMPSRVLPGFQPDSKIRMLQQMADDVEIIIAINANDIEKNKVRGDLGITYDEDVLRLHRHLPLHGFRTSAAW